MVIAKRIGWMVLISWVAWSCASVVRQADDLFEAGEYTQAARAYESYLSSDPEAGPATSRALYRLAVTYGSSASSLYDPAKSVRVLERLLAEDPDGEYSLAAQAMLDLHEEVVSLGAVMASRRQLIQALLAELSRLQEDLARTESEVGYKNDEVQALEERIQHLRSEVALLSRHLSEREVELQQLKEIDLEAPPF